MAGDTQVIADGVEGEVTRKRSSSPWLIGGLSLVLAAGFAIVSLTPIGLEDDLETTPGDSVLAGPDIGEPATQFGISEIIEGFDGAVVGVAGADDAEIGAELDYILWPQTGTMVTRPMFGGTEVRFDFGGQHLAVTRPSRDGSDLELSVGRSNSIRKVVPAATSYAWHDGVSGTLAYTTEVDGRWSLWRLQPNLVSSLVSTDQVPGGEIVAWGEWGFAIQSPDGRVVLLTANGEFKTAHAGTAFTSSPDGWLIVANENLDLLSSGGGVVRLDVSPDRVGTLVAAAFSPDGELLAMAGSKGLLVFPVRGDGEVREFAIRDAERLTWSLDNRFLAIPQESGISVLDLATVNRYSILEDFSFLAVDVVATSSS